MAATQVGMVNVVERTELRIVCDKHGVTLPGGVCDLCLLESLSRQREEYTRRHFPGAVVPAREFRSIQEIMNG